MAKSDQLGTEFTAADLMRVTAAARLAIALRKQKGPVAWLNKKHRDLNVWDDWQIGEEVRHDYFLSENDAVNILSLKKGACTEYWLDPQERKDVNDLEQRFRNAKLPLAA